MRVLTIAGAILALAAPATAGVHSAKADVLSTTVAYADLDLSRTAGADLMLNRIAQAARYVCGEAPRPGDLAKRKRHRACLATATDSAVAKLDAPVVTARHQGRNPAMLAAR